MTRIVQVLRGLFRSMSSAGRAAGYPQTVTPSAFETRPDERPASTSLTLDEIPGPRD